MITYILRRLLQALLVMLVMSGLVFVGLYVIGDPVSMMASPEATELDREAIRKSFGLESTRGIMTGSVLGFSLPNFWVGLMLIMVFAVGLGWVPASGRGDTVMLGPFDLSVLTVDGWRSLVLPALTIAIAKAALIIRVTRAATRESLPMDYIKFARAKGLAWGRILRVHLLKNILIPIVTISGLEFGQVVAFAVVTETVFAWPGMGKLLLDSIITLDRPVVVAYLILIVFFLVMLNLVVDILYSILDPRVRLQGSAA